MYAFIHPFIKTILRMETVGFAKSKLVTYEIIFCNSYYTVVDTIIVLTQQSHEPKNRTFPFPFHLLNWYTYQL